MIRNTLREECEQLRRENSQLRSLLRWARSALAYPKGKDVMDRIDRVLAETRRKE